MDRKVFTAILLAVIVVGLVCLAFALFSPFLLALLWAAVLAVVCYDAYALLARLLRGHRRTAAAIMTLLVLLLIIGPFAALLLFVVEDVVDLAEDLRPENLKTRVAAVMDQPLVKQALAGIRDFIGREISLEEVSNYAERLLGPAVNALSNVVQFLFRLLAGIFFVTLSIFFFFRDGPAAARAIRELIPMSEADRDAILGDIQGAINAAVRGGLVTALAQGLLGFIILFILGIEKPVLLACAMALASLIPLVGTAVIWGPVAIWLAIDGEIVKALILVGYGVLVIGMADNFLRPLLVGRHMEAHPLLLFFGTLGGIALFGFAGIVLGPVVVALLNVTVRLFRREFARSATPPASPPPA
ncbi:MAG: AI-2E family transporter [Planctomycetota bacterium]|jgi:predicted PurR-regulated permease PerM